MGRPAKYKTDEERKEAQKAYQKAYREANKVKIRDYQAKYRAANPNYQKIYREIGGKKGLENSIYYKGFGVKTMRGLVRAKEGIDRFIAEHMQKSSSAYQNAFDYTLRINHVNGRDYSDYKENQEQIDDIDTILRETATNHPDWTEEQLLDEVRKVKGSLSFR